MLPSWRSSTAVLESEHQIPTKAWFNCFIAVSFCASCLNKVSKCSTQIAFIISLRPLSALPELQHLSLFFLFSGIGSVVWVGDVPQRKSSSLVTVFKKAPLASYLFLSVGYFQSLVLTEKFVFLKRRLHGSGEKDRAGLLLVASSI